MKRLGGVSLICDYVRCDRLWLQSSSFDQFYFPAHGWFDAYWIPVGESLLKPDSQFSALICQQS
jgi:hypothetical protein